MFIEALPTSRKTLKWLSRFKTWNNITHKVSQTSCNHYMLKLSQKEISNSYSAKTQQRSNILVSLKVATKEISTGDLCSESNYSGNVQTFSIHGCLAKPRFSQASTSWASTEIFLGVQNVFLYWKCTTNGF